MSITPVAINLSGVIAGTYVNGNFFSHSFIRDPSGVITDFDMVHSTGRYSNGINDSNLLVGGWTDFGHVGAGFMRDASGTMIPFPVPGADHGTYPTSISKAGRITGFYGDAASIVHGFAK